MILTCPNCSARYLLSSSAVGEQGRDVRCAKCQHEWFQDVDDVDVAETATQEADSDSPVSSDISSDAIPEKPVAEEEPIPDSVKPLPEGSNVPAYTADVLSGKPSMQAQITGYVAAAFLFLALIVGGFAFKAQLVNAWPPAAMIYEIASAPVSLKGEGLVMESLSATLLKDAEGQDVLVLKGRVINLTEKTVDVPPMIAVLRSTNGEDGESWIIDSPADQVAPGASFVFTSDYPAAPRGVGSVNLAFVPTIAGMKMAEVHVAEVHEEKPSHEAEPHQEEAHEAEAHHEKKPSPPPSSAHAPAEHH